MNDLILDIKDLEVIYETDIETVYAINGIDLKLNKGQTLGIVGETGAGKTTTALSIMKLLPDRVGKIINGQILFDGQDIINLKEDKMRKLRGAEISMIFQDPMTSLNPVMTVGYQLAEAIKLHKDVNKVQLQEEVDEMFEMVGIPPDRKDDYPHQFSGGMKQRIVIAMALACDSKVLIADEPTTALDVTIQAQILNMMTELKEIKNTSMILITHDLAVVSEICDIVSIMYAGEIIESGTKQDIFKADGHHPYTDGLFKSIPSLTEESKRLMPIEGLMPDPSSLPKGCKFHPRCPLKMDICSIENPKNYEFGSHKIKCHLFSKD